MLKTVKFSSFCSVIIFLNIYSAISASDTGNVCSPLPYSSLPNGQIIQSGLQKFRFRCDKGYFLAGPSAIRCRKGKWTSLEPPLCLKSEGQCDDPPSIPNGDILGSDRRVGSSVQYMCHPEYFLLGNGRRECMEAGGWSGVTPSCFAESEPLQNIARRLDRQFVTKVGSASADSVVQARSLSNSAIYKGLELVILVDRSSSIDPHDFESGKAFIKYLFEEFGVKNGENERGTRAAVIAFGQTVNLLFNVNNQSINSTEAAVIALQTLQPGGGGTDLETALTTTFVRIIPLLRPEAKRAIFLITDGEPNIGGTHVPPEKMAAALRNPENFEIFTVGIGRDINKQLLANIASEPAHNHVFLIDKYSHLRDIMRLIKNQPTEAPPIDPEKCGIAHTASKKEKGEEGTSPWTAAVYVFHPELLGEGLISNSSSELSLCGGVLICSEWVLTAASCFFKTDRRDIHMTLQETFIVLGENDLTKKDDTQMNFYSTNVVVHPDFDPFNSLLNNLALVKLNQPVPTDKYRPVCLPPTDKIVPLHLNVEANTSVAGWGLDPEEESIDGITGGSTRQTLYAKPLVLVGDQECRRSAKRKIQEKNIFCAGLGYASMENCVGNVGSPIVASDPDTTIYHVLGILTQNMECKNGYSQFTELRNYIPWINTATEKCHIRHWM